MSTLQDAAEKIVQELLDNIKPSAKVEQARFPDGPGYTWGCDDVELARFSDPVEQPNFQVDPKINPARVNPCVVYSSSTGRWGPTGEWFIDDNDLGFEDVLKMVHQIVDGTKTQLGLGEVSYVNFKQLVMELEHKKPSLSMTMDDLIIHFH